MQQTLELATDKFHSLLTHDFNVDGTSEILVARYNKNATDVGIIHPKTLSSNIIRINERINCMSVAQASLDRGFELITGNS